MVVDLQGSHSENESEAQCWLNVGLANLKSAPSLSNGEKPETFFFIRYWGV